MKITYRLVYDNVAQLESFSKEKLPWVIGLALGKNLLPLRAEWQLIEEARAAIARQYVENKEDGSNFIQDQEGFQKAYTELFTEEFEYKVATIPISDLKDIEDVTGADIAALLALGIMKE